MASSEFSAPQLAEMLYASIHEKLLALPDDTLIYPAHGAGSLCGRKLSTETVSTIGEQKRFNYALQPMSRDQFVKLVTADQPDAPAYFAHAAAFNQRERETLESSLERVRPLSLPDVLGSKEAGGQLLDVREPAEFAGAHFARSVNIALGGKFATWAGTLLDRRRPIVIVADCGGEKEAATRLGRIGFDQVIGFLDGGMRALEDRADLVAVTRRVTAAELALELASPNPPLVLDVRMPSEWNESRIEGSRNIPLNHLRERLAELPSSREIVVHCASGYRSSIAASLLERAGLDGITDLVGGFAAWEAFQG